ncbi:NAD-dependent epimerase/dehydratase family protein [Lujinxingia vulgaris]|nr:NAD(P)-dependent oxidoreductase [Lujinxingia vulgaris]
MRVFLTGGTGFVGSHVAEVLQDAGHEVVALVRESSDVRHLSALGVEQVVGSMGAPEALLEVLKGCEVVIHVAGMTTGKSPQELFEVNGAGSGKLAQVAAEAGVGRFIYVSSTAAQGPGQGREPRPRGLRPEPVSHYGRSKLMGEGAVLAVREQMGVTILRPPPVYGPRDRDMFQVFQLAKFGVGPVLGDGSRWLSVIHVHDVARAALRCLEDEGTANIYTVDDGGRYTWRDLTRIVGEAVGRRPVHLPIPQVLFGAAAVLSEVGGKMVGATPIFNTDKYAEMSQQSWVCGHEAIAEKLGWAPSLNLEEGARQTAQWYREQGWI